MSAVELRDASTVSTQPLTFALVDGPSKCQETSVDAGAERLERGSAAWPCLLKDYSPETQCSE